MGWEVNVSPQSLYPRERNPVPIVQGGEWAQWAAWTGTVKLDPTGVRTPDRPARSESL